MSEEKKVIEHSPTPWACDHAKGVITSAGNAGVEFAEANAERIVACVNACAGISTEALTSLEWQIAPKRGATPELVAEMLLKMRDLKRALAGMVECFEVGADHNDYLTWANAQALITKE